MQSINIETEKISEITGLREEVSSQREAGEVILEIRKITPQIALGNDENIILLINKFVTQLGYSDIGNGWKQINQKEAQKILNSILTKDLAYSGDLMSSTDAQKQLKRFISFFSENSRFFTNAIFNQNYSGLRSWSSITGATFDTGVVVVSPDRIGILWVQDED